MKFLCIFLGGGLGAILRYFIGVFFNQPGKSHLPIGTLTVNLAGSLIIGFLAFWFSRQDISSELKGFILTGFLGAFTTFSTYILESYDLIQKDMWQMAFLYITISTIIGLLFAFGGWNLGKFILQKV